MILAELGVLVDDLAAQLDRIHREQDVLGDDVRDDLRQQAEHWVVGQPVDGAVEPDGDVTERRPSR